MRRHDKKHSKPRRLKLVRSATKLVLNLAILASFGMLIWYAYVLFTHRVDPLIGSILFIAGITAWVLLIKLLRSRYKWTKPSFKLTTFSVIAIPLILTFAGVQPMTSYKDETFSRVAIAWGNWQSEQEQRRIVEENRKAAEEVEAEQKEEKKAEFDKAISNLTSPELVAEYMRDNVSYDYEKYQEWLTGDFYWGFDTPEEVFSGKKTNCGGYARFALYSLLNAGYNYDNFEENKTNAAVILGSMGLDYHDVHTVLLYIEDNLFYIIDLDKIKGPFETIEDAATASLPTWITYYFYDIDTKVTKTVKRELSEEELKIREEQTKAKQKEAIQNKLSEMEHEVLLLVNLIRADRGSSILQWDDKLYEYAKSHSEDMGKAGEMFHTDMHKSYAENAWWGGGSSWEAIDIVESWMTSEKHRTWLLCPNLKRVAVGIVYSNSGMYASWTFWRSETQYADWWYVNGTSPPNWWH